MSGRLAGGAPVSMEEVMKQMAQLQLQMQSLIAARTTEVPHDRDIDKAIYLPGSCPAPLMACDPEVEAKQGRTCPDVREYAPDPLIVDADGRICYAPEDLRKWAGSKSLADLDTAIEKFASEVLRQMDNADVLKRLKEQVLDGSIMDATKPRLLEKDACAADGDDKCVWSTVVSAQYPKEDLDAGLAEAVGLFNKPVADVSGWENVEKVPAIGSEEGWVGWLAAKAGATTTVSDVQDYVFRAYGKPWQTKPADVIDAYKTPVNPATVAYAGAYAWAKQADAQAARLGGDFRATFVARVRSLLPTILNANKGVFFGLTKEGSGDYVVKNLTFDVAWPFFMERTIGLRGLVRAAESVKTIDNIDGKTFSAKPAREQWDLIIKQYRRTAKF